MSLLRLVSGIKRPPTNWRRWTLPAGIPPSLVGSLQVVDSPLLRQQVEAQRLGIKHLKNENNRLKVLLTAILCLFYWLVTETKIKFDVSRPRR